MKAFIYLLSIAFFSMVLCQEEGEGQRRLRKLTERAEQSRGIISFNNQDFDQFAMKYPRPYDLVIYFTGSSCKLCEQLGAQYEYMASLYEQQGIRKSDNPVFFAKMTYNRENQETFKIFNFQSIPNLVVSKPEMAIVSEIQKKQYLQKFKWAISNSDGDVTTHKMLDFVNQRTGHDVLYKPTLKTMLTFFFGFITVMGAGVLIYTKMRKIWTHWVVWFAGVMLIYVVCVSGVVYDIIHDVPFVGRDRQTGQAVIFTSGTRQQYGAEGAVISLTITLVGLLFVSIGVLSQKDQSVTRVRFWGLISLVIILFLVFQIEDVYKSKSWYGPSFYPPHDYSRGPISADQGNNI